MPPKKEEKEETISKLKTIVSSVSTAFHFSSLVQNEVKSLLLTLCSLTSAGKNGKPPQTCGKQKIL